MENKSKFYSGLCIMTGLIILGAMFPISAKVFKSYDRTVNVKGLCEREVAADKVIWPVVLKVSGNDIDALYRDVNRQNETVRQFLLAGGIKEEEISLSITSSDKYTLEYSNDRAYRYILTSVVTVCTENVDAVVALRSHKSDLFAKGIMIVEDDWNNQTIFSFEGLNDIKPEMIEEATRNARASAIKFAEDSESHLGKIKDASQGTFTITDRDSNTPYIKKVRVVTSVTYYLAR